MASPRKSVATGISSDNTAQAIDITVPAGQECVLYNVAVGNESNVEVTQPEYRLECPPGTTVFDGHSPQVLNFGSEGLVVPYTDSGDNVRLDIDAAASGLQTTGFMVYSLRTATQG